MQQRGRGFGLIELLVAVAIVAVIAGIAVVAVGSAGGPRQAEREAERLAALIELACERAALGGRAYGLHFGRSGYAFGRRFGAEWRQDRDGELRARTLPVGLELSVHRADVPLPLDREPSRDPQGFCQPSGELAPLILALAKPGAPPFVRVALSADGRITRMQDGG